MKTKAKIFIIAASLGLLSSQAFTASSGINQRDHFRFDRTNPAGQDVIVENNNYRKNQVVPSQISVNRENNRNSKSNKEKSSGRRR
jgi:hypothetical protein